MMNIGRWLLLSSLTCCGGDPAKPPASSGVTVTGDLPKPVAVARPKLGVPKDAALVMTADLSLLLKTGAIAELILHALDIDDLKTVGLDAARPATLVMSSVSVAERALIDELRPMATSTASASSVSGICKRVLALSRPSFIRILVPASNAAALEHAVAKFLVKEDGWRHVRDGLTKGSRTITVSDDDSYVAFDFGSGSALKPMPSADQPPPALDGQEMRATWNPSALANIGFIDGIDKTCQAVSGEGIDVSQRDALAAQGLYESGRVFPLATFDTITADLTLSPFALTLRAKPGPRFTMPGADAFAATTSVMLAESGLSMEATQALTRAWPLPGGDYETFRHMVRDAGAYGVLVGLPHLAANMPFELLEDRSDPITGDPTIAKHFERIEAAQTTEYVTVGVLPAGTTRAAAECALETTTKCPTKSHLKVGAPVRRTSSPGPSSSDRFAKLVELRVAGETSPRFAVLVARQEAAFTAAVARTTSALHIDFTTKELIQAISRVGALPFAVPNRVAGDLSVSDGQLVMKLGGS